jgi:hypothetical protein
MKRDMELIRSVLLKLEEDVGLQLKTYAFQFDNSKMVIEGHTDEEVYRHVVMLLESPFVEGKQMMSGEIVVRGLTWEGREFLDSIRGDVVWKKTKAGVEKIGGTGLGFVWEIAKGIIKNELKTKLGIDPT